ncbi:MAG: ribonuclease R [Gammaproteobacteria bacterium]|nr:ribonuclease R [Gammaproteobacteria bacterium]
MGVEAAVQANRLNAKVVLRVFDGRDEPLSWKFLNSALGTSNPVQIKRLRQILKGLVRTHELRLIDGHLYERLGNGSDPADPDLLGQGEVITLDGISRVNGLSILPGKKGLPSPRSGDVVDFQTVTGKALVVKIVKHSPLPVVGILNLRGRAPSVDPLGRNFNGRIALSERPQNAQHGDTVRVAIQGDNEQGLYGHLLEVVPADSVLEQAIHSTLDSLDIPTEWSDATRKATARLPKSVKRVNFPQRQDLTNLPLVTIDGATAKDFDDAVFVRALSGRRGWRLIVAIADVSHYVKPRSALDDDAQIRTTSVSLPSFVVPMLPEAISNELCSLKADVDRLALVCDMHVAANGEVRDFDFYDAVICSHGRLTYEQVQAHIDNGSELPVASADRKPVAKSVAALAALHDAFRQAREQRGGLDFETRAGVIEIIDGHVTGVSQVQRIKAHQMIEEAMINANVCAARFIERAQQCSLYRVHEAPDPIKLEELALDLRGVGLSLPKGIPEPIVFKRLLDELGQRSNGWLYQQLILRSMQQAVYTPKNQGHFGLGLERYMHFTSPIRRYPDLLVHRAIKAILADQASRMPSLEQLENYGERCSSNERRAESAGWTVEAWLKCDLLKQRTGDTFTGTIAGVTEFGLFVDIEGYFVQGLLHISDLGADYFRFERAQQCLVGERNGKRYGLGDRIQVLVANVEPAQGKIDLRRVRQDSKPGGSKASKGAPQKHKSTGKAAKKHRRSRRSK